MSPHQLAPKVIGGYFEAEQKLRQSTSFHPNAISVTSGRAALQRILKQTQAKLVYIPFYICDSILSVLRAANINFCFYGLSEALKPLQLPELKANELFLYVNYFGLQYETVELLISQYGQNLILDNTQAFFSIPEQTHWSFNSARKFFGVPDGGYLYTPVPLEHPAKPNENFIITHLTERAEGRVKEGYVLFLQNENSISSNWLDMSSYTREILEKLDYETIQEQRRTSFLTYHDAFSSLNKLHLPIQKIKTSQLTPFCYPILLDFPVQHQLLHEQNIFIPTLWQDVIVRESDCDFALEKTMSKNLLCLPVDHRYTETSCQFVINTILSLLNLSRNG